MKVADRCSHQPAACLKFGVPTLSPPQRLCLHSVPFPCLFFPFYLFFEVLRFELRATHMQGKHSAELLP
jgi:hypothetical protein